ncbi:MAG: TlpA family protein disulfide reductase [Saprospiraceae bacterium]
MKFNLLFAILIVFAFNLQAQTAFPSIPLKTLDGHTVNAQDLCKTGKITVVSFWATWCSPCKKELDTVNEVYEEWQKKYDMEVVAITIDDARAITKVKPMVESKGWTFRVLSDVNSDLKRALNFPSVPQTFLLNKEGKIVYSHSGYIPGDEEDLEKHIKEIADK